MLYVYNCFKVEKSKMRVVVKCSLFPISNAASANFHLKQIFCLRQFNTQRDSRVSLNTSQNILQILGFNTNSGEFLCLLKYKLFFHR